ncbi:MAG: G5 domain-containing protein [Clostridia bacterium]
MKNDEKASISLKRIIAISIIFLFLTGIAVVAGNVKLNNVKIILSSGYEMNVLTAKTKVSEILDENHIIILEDEKVIPDLEEELSSNNTIKIFKNTDEEIEIATEIESSANVKTEDLLKNYEQIVEKIVTEEVKIPYETITKDVSTGSSAKQDKIIQYGVDGLKRVTYKIKYQNNIEIEKTEISSEIIKEPIDKIVEIRTKQITSRSSNFREASTNPALTASTTLAKRVEGITPKVATFNTSAYCPCMSCCGKTNGITASGAPASEWYTLAAGSVYPIGTVIYIPYFKDKPNGGWFVVQDRGGAISSDRLDIFYDSHSAALQFGRRYLECYVYEF